MLRFLVNGYRSLHKGDRTFFSQVREVPYACNLVIGPELRAEPQRYWMPRHTPQKMTIDEAVEGLGHHLTESMRLRLRSDVPLAFCLSGGVDSGALASIAAASWISSGCNADQ